MATTNKDINQIENVRRIENFAIGAMNGLCMELTHGVYPHDDIYGGYCTLKRRHIAHRAWFLNIWHRDAISKNGRIAYVISPLRITKTFWYPRTK